jgi:uncharacterized integral membrane protein (TIGR00698 family)
MIGSIGSSIMSFVSTKPQKAGSGLTALQILPGLALTASIAAAAFGLRLLPGLAILSPMILAILIGTAFHNLIGAPALARPGIAFSMRRILRAAIVLLGLQLTFVQVGEIGGRGLIVIIAAMSLTFGFTVWVGRLLGADRRLALLIAAGTSICGASAVIATNTVANAAEEDVAYAVACVTVFGSIAMFLYPLLPALLNLNAHDYGLWSGASIHEIAQVVAAAFQQGQQAGEAGTIAKLSRVILLAPMVIGIGLVTARVMRRTGGDGHSSARAPMPWFVFGFIGMIVVNSLVSIPPEAKGWIVWLTAFMLSVALAAMGLETDVRKLAAKGARPALLGALASVFIAVLSLSLIKLFA